MKTTSLHLLALFCVFAVPAVAQPEVTTIGGCAMIRAENGNWFFKADPDCVARFDGRQGSRNLTYQDVDGDAATPDQLASRED